MVLNKLSTSLLRSVRGLTPPPMLPWWDRIEASPIGLRLARGAFWSLFGTVIARALGILASVVVARILGKAGYGEFGIVQNTLATFTTFAGLGMGLTAAKYVAEFRGKDPVRAGKIIGLSNGAAWVTGGLMVVLLNLFAPWVAAHFLARPQLTTVVRIGSLIILFSAVTGAQTGALNGFEAFKASSHRNIVCGVISFPMMVCGAYYQGLPGAIVSLLITQILNVWLNHRLLEGEARRFGIKIGLQGALQEMPILWRFSIPALISGVMVVPVQWLCQTILVRYPNGYAEMGVFTAANTWGNVIQFLPAMLVQPLMPVLSERLGLGDVHRSLKAVKAIMLISLAIVVPIVLVGSALSPWIMRLYGREFAGSWPVLVVLLCTAGLLAVETPVGQVISASGKMWYAVVMNLGWALVIVTLTSLWASHGALGLALATFVAYVVHGVWTLGYIWIRMKGVRN